MGEKINNKAIFAISNIAPNSQAASLIHREQLVKKIY
jgi:hypothetical protein